MSKTGCGEGSLHFPKISLYFFIHLGYPFPKGGDLMLQWLFCLAVVTIVSLAFFGFLKIGLTALLG
jgi:hypothetical protein